MMHISRSEKQNVTVNTQEDGTETKTRVLPISGMETITLVKSPTKTVKVF